MTNKVFLSTKTYTHAQGLSACFRQWNAKSHCRFMHGYALEVKLTFAAPRGLDENNWVMDFGGLKEINHWLADVFDHKTLVAQDDPELETFRELHARKIIDIVIVEHIGCEAFASMVFDKVDAWLTAQPKYTDRVFLSTAEVREHVGNSALCLRSSNQDEMGDI